MQNNSKTNAASAGISYFRHTIVLVVVPLGELFGFTSKYIQVEGDSKLFILALETTMMFLGI